MKPFSFPSSGSKLTTAEARIAQLEAKIENFRFEKQQLVEELTEASDKLSEMEAEAEMQIERLEALEGTSSTYKHAAAELKQVRRSASATDDAVLTDFCFRKTKN